MSILVNLGYYPRIDDYQLRKQVRKTIKGGFGIKELGTIQRDLIQNLLYELNQLQTDKIWFDFIILLPKIMSLIERVLDSITNKQEQVSNNLGLAFKTFLSGSSENFVKDLAFRFKHHLEESLDNHSAKIRQFLFVQNPSDQKLLIQAKQQSFNNILPHQKSIEVQEKQLTSAEQVANQIKTKIDGQQRDTSKKQVKRRKKLTEIDEDISQNPQPKTDEVKKKRKQPQNVQYSNPRQQTANPQTIQKRNNKNFNIKHKDITQSLNQKQTTKNGPILVSDSADRIQNFKYLQQRNKMRGKSIKGKPRKLRTNLIKLTPIALEKERQMKMKEANEKIQAALEFLNNLPSKKKVTSVHITEWKHQKSDRTLGNKNNSTAMNPNFIKLKQIAQKYKQQKSHQLEAVNLHQSDVTRKRHKVQKMQRFELQKPQVYNLYNINMHKNQVFKLKRF